MSAGTLAGDTYMQFLSESRDNLLVLPAPADRRTELLPEESLVMLR